MKKLLIAAAVALISVSAFAEMSSSAPQGSGAAMTANPGMMGEHGGGHPCMAVKEACEKAGFVKGGESKGNGLWKDCVMPLMQGQAVKNVSISADVVAACKAKKEAHRGMQGQDMQGKMQ